MAVQEGRRQAAERHQEYWTRYDGTRQASRQNGGGMGTNIFTPNPKDDDLTPQECAAKLAALPTDPDRLLAHVKGDRHWATKPEGDPGDREHPDARAFRVLSVYLDQEVPVPPKLAAAIFRALARIPAVRTYTGVRDALGRPGIGIVYEPGAPGAPGVGVGYDEKGEVVSRSYIVLDPTTYRYLGRRVDYLRDEIINGEVAFRKGSFYASAEVASGVVDKPGQLP
ncbi:CU044_5270 family protein [Streptosporangium saharense]|uniref:CU044_5270 family protein n=1 Tax=Streptosporangium saharense TaxID=1706840 RepID=UPI00368379D0